MIVDCIGAVPEGMICVSLRVCDFYGLIMTNWSASYFRVIFWKAISLRVIFSKIISLCDLWESDDVYYFDLCQCDLYQCDMYRCDLCQYDPYQYDLY